MTDGAEIWKPVVGFYGYQVSSLGRVRSFKRYRSGRILKPNRVGPNKRAMVSLYRDDTPHFRLVSWLVCEAFHGPRPEGLQSAHEDGNAQNDIASNLSWKRRWRICRTATVMDEHSAATFITRRN